jgi:DNA-binding PadR family transcriptional regulator
MHKEWWTSGRGWAALGFGPWGRSKFFDAGEVRLAILSLLGDGPKHGYELIKALEARSGGLYRASAGTVYPTLQQLEDEGLVTSDQQEGKRVYRVTEAGRDELARESRAINDIWNRAERWREWSGWMGPQTAALAGPVASLVKAAMRGVARRPEHESQIRDILERARRDVEALEPTKA